MKLFQLHEDIPGGTNRAATQLGGLPSWEAQEEGRIQAGARNSVDNTPHGKALKGDHARHLPGVKGDTQKKNKIRKLSGDGAIDRDIDDPTSWTEKPNPRAPLTSRPDGGRGKQSKPWTPTV